MRERDRLDELVLQLMSEASQEVDGLGGIVVVFIDREGCISCRAMRYEETSDVALGVVEKVKEAVKSCIVGTVQEMGEIAVRIGA